MSKRSRFIDEMDVPNTDLRVKPNCGICGVRITSKNFGMSETQFTEGWSKVVYFCENCFSKHISEGYEEVKDD